MLTPEQRAALQWLACEDSEGWPMGESSQAAIAAALADLDACRAALGRLVAVRSLLERWGSPEWDANDHSWTECCEMLAETLGEERP